MISPKYTEVLCNIVESGVNIFNFSYPIYNVSYKVNLEKAIIRHYYFREIGSETVGRFLYNLNTLMNEVMPKYNRLYKYLAENNVNPLSNFSEIQEAEGLTSEDVSELNTLINNLKKGISSNNTNTSTITTTKDANTHTEFLGKFSDTPQGQVSVLDNSYLTNITDDDTLTTDNSIDVQNGNLTQINREDITDTGTTNDNKSKKGSISKKDKIKRTGYTGIGPGSALEDYVRKFEEVDDLIIRELSPLFLGVF